MTSIEGVQITFAVPHPPAQRDSITSQQAAALIEPSAGTLRAQVLAYVRTCGDAGATDEEMQTELKMNPSTQRPRRIELEKLGLILRTTNTRKTASGRSATVFVAAPAEVVA